MVRVPELVYVQTCVVGPVIVCVVAAACCMLLQGAENSFVVESLFGTWMKRLWQLQMVMGRVLMVVVARKRLVGWYSLVVMICWGVSHGAVPQWEMVDVVVHLLEGCLRCSSHCLLDQRERKVDLVEVQRGYLEVLVKSTL